MATGVYMAPDGRHPAALVTVEAACGLLQDYEAPAFTIAAVQCLRGAKLLSAAEISKLMPTNGIQSSEEGEDTKSDNDSDAPAVVQRPEQAAMVTCSGFSQHTGPGGHPCCESCSSEGRSGGSCCATGTAERAMPSSS